MTGVDPALGPVIAAVVARIGRQRITLSHATPFEAVARAIVYQSVSGKVAAAVFARLKSTAGAAFTPARILAISRNSIRAVGLSKSKTDAVCNLAEWFAANRKAAKALPKLPDEQVIVTLTGIAGIVRGPPTFS